MGNVFAFESSITGNEEKLQASVLRKEAEKGKKSLPPISNRGAVNTYRDGMEALFDWVSVTFRDLEIDDLILVLGLKKDDFTELDRGGLGYKSRMIDGHISIFYDGAANMGIHLQLSGQGCREYEGKKGFKGWDVFFARLYDLGGNFTRVDIAIDDRKGHFKIKTLAQKAGRGEISSRFKSAVSFEKMSLRDGESKGQTLNFGSRSSRIMIRMYDKKEEQEGKGNEVNADSWNRIELEVKKESANKLITEYLFGKKSVGDLAAGLLRNYIRFLKPGTDTNKSRWATWAPWEKFLGGVEAIRIAIDPKEKTIDEKISWLERSIAPSLAAVSLAESEKFVKAIIKKGYDRIKPETYAMIDEYKNSDFMPSWKKELRNKVLFGA